jgi:hypothetical protein
MEGFIAGVVVGAVGMALGVVYEAWRARPEVESPGPEAWEPGTVNVMRLTICDESNDNPMTLLGVYFAAAVVDEWADAEARALEAAEKILRGRQP